MKPKPHEKKPESRIVLTTTTERKSAYVRAANRANTTLANWLFTVCDQAAGHVEGQER